MHKVLINPGSIVTSRLEMFYRSTMLSTGTGFFSQLEDKVYLVSNWHNFAGRNPGTMKPLSSHGGIPDRVKLTVCHEGKLGPWSVIEAKLYRDSDISEHPREPNWFVHERHHHRVDVAAIEVSIPAGLEVHPIGTVDRTPDMLISVAADVFILGYPRGISGGGVFPIWKRASIASEPGLDLDELPKMLVDTATREGMSGSPVVAVSTGGYMSESGSQILGPSGSKFIGIYSGRLGSGELQAQLGLVWKSQVVTEILKAQIQGVGSFHT